MAKLPPENQELTARSGVRHCWLCKQAIEEGEDAMWFDNRPAHEGCAFEEEQEA